MTARASSDDMDFLRHNAALVLPMIARFATLDPDLLRRHRAKLNKDLLRQNHSLTATSSSDAFPTDDPRLTERWRAFVSGGSLAPGDARTEAFLAAHRAELEASYATGYAMRGRDWEADRETGWALLGTVGELDWSEHLIASLADRLDFRRLSGNAGVPWTESLLERFASRWDWERLAANEAVPWTPALVERFRQVSLAALSTNTRFPWTAPFIETHADVLDWRALARNEGVPWTASFASRFTPRFSWQDLLQNPVCVFRDAILEAHGDAIDWEALSRSYSFAWTPAVLRRFADEIDWPALSSASAVFTEALVDELEGRIDFGANGLSQNVRLAWTRGLLERHRERLDTRELSRNTALWQAVFAPILDASTLDAFLSATPAAAGARKKG